MRQQRITNARQTAEDEARLRGDVPPTLSGRPMTDSVRPKGRSFDHPGALESLIPVWGSGKDALADLEDHNYAGAAINGVMAASDVMLAKALLTGLAKGGLKLAGNQAWRSAPWQEQGARAWLGERGFLKPNQPGHHWWIEQKSKVPDWIKNQPPFITPMKDAVQHGRIHGRYKVDGVQLPQFKRPERLWYGTPGWLKAAYVSSAGHSGAFAGRVGREEPASTAPSGR